MNFEYKLKTDSNSWWIEVGAIVTLCLFIFVLFLLWHFKRERKEKTKSEKYINNDFLHSFESLQTARLLPSKLY